MTTKEMLIEYSLLMVDIFVLLIRVLCEYVIAFVKLFIPLQRKSICGDLVVLTGAGQGLGREVAHQLGALGAHLALLDINEVRTRLIITIDCN